MCRTNYGYAMDTGAMTVLKVQEVPNYDPSNYRTQRTHARARDGTQIPITLVGAQHAYARHCHENVCNLWFGWSRFITRMCCPLGPMSQGPGSVHRRRCPRCSTGGNALTTQNQTKQHNNTQQNTWALGASFATIPLVVFVSKLRGLSPDALHCT